MPRWVPESLVVAIGRIMCRLFRQHNVTCRGRADHKIPGVGLIDPERWNRWQRR